MPEMVPQWRDLPGTDGWGEAGGLCACVGLLASFQNCCLQVVRKTQPLCVPAKTSWDICNSKALVIFSDPFSSNIARLRHSP